MNPEFTDQEQRDKEHQEFLQRNKIHWYALTINKLVIKVQRFNHPPESLSQFDGILFHPESQSVFDGIQSIPINGANIEFYQVDKDLINIQDRVQR